MLDAVANAIQHEKKTRGLSLEAFAGELGYLSKSQLGDVANKKTERGGKQNISFALVQRLYADLCQRETPIGTTPFLDITNIGASARERRELMCIAGRTGVGKTEACKHIVRTNPATWYVRCHHLDTPSDVLGRLAQSMGIDTAPREGKKETKKRFRARMIAAIAHAASSTEAPALLIFDDAHHLRDVNFYHDLFDIYELLKGLSGMLLVGTELLETMLKKWAGYDKDMHRRHNTKPMMDEFFRRFSYFGRFSGLSHTDVATVCEAYQIGQAKAIAQWLAYGKGVLQYSSEGVSVRRNLPQGLPTRPELEMGMVTNWLKTAIESAGSPQNVTITHLLSLFAPEQLKPEKNG